MIFAMAAFVGLAAFGVGGAVAIAIRISARQFTSFLMRGDYVARHENGIAAVQGGKLVRLSWSEVHQFSGHCQFTGRGFYRVLAKRYDLVALDGRRIVLEHFLTDLERLVAVIRKEMFPILLQRAVTDLVTSKWVSFGCLSLHVDQGIQVLQEVVPWANLARYEVAGGRLLLFCRNGQPLSIECAHIANLDVALFLLERHWRAQSFG